MKRRVLAAVACVLTLLAAACSTSKDDADDGGTPAQAVQRSGLLADNGACDSSKPVYKIGMMTPFQTAAIAHRSQVDAAEAAITAFNSRGGIAGHCIDLEPCDTHFDPNGELDCARQFADGDVVATINDTTQNSADVTSTLQTAGLARVGGFPNVADIGVKNLFPIGGGSTGNVFMVIPPLAQTGVSKIALIAIDTPAFQRVPDLMKPMLEAHGAEITKLIPVAAGTTDYQQFVLAATDSGAKGAALITQPADTAQVLRAAQQLSSPLKFSLSLGTSSLTDLKQFGTAVKNVTFVSEVPPVTGSRERWPVLGDVLADFQASGESDLRPENVDAGDLKSWMSVLALVQVLGKAGDPDDVSRKAVLDAFSTAKNVDMHGLIPSWTPLATGPGLFGGVSDPWYYQVTFDPDSGQFTVSDKLLNLVSEFAGEADYAQPS
ncbi:ABC transporter substrate-binding protein [Frankia sp. CNm7]|uniref:ABC transporter substrate-binding protein n=1 Tax=Frankia nepalensis TaxID=1836974 RepID=A0A937USQ9_9ACTN|nr:ABC transporter substrate-binding protein [Frankia nepalensis]MBL7500994.1 ABC transporter substrate-binding protein [Frankia nepalensis]MBL7512460.1 ABC transporter substrate-binding protein [Frankia nepalensis]MBL7521525.1 ABC transporter substrate-binding protein [Frankia nepalensis]MBL7632762.1 ABC transporter substrate-binding protein [Frankia nepalensis]